MKVELLDWMGSDLDVCNAARVSFAKESKWDEWLTHPDTDEQVKTLSPKDAKLIHYLAKHGHWTPFSHCYAKFRIKAPLFVRSQLFKHKVGLTENEVSRRYVDSEPEFYFPEVWRKRADNVKQGSSDEASSFDGEYVRSDSTHSTVTGFYRDALNLYQEMIRSGVAPELARATLPTSTYTEWVWSGSIAAFARVYSQRTHENAQHETKQVAIQIGELLEPLYPVSWKSLCATS